jgi:hypothetical protein
VGPYETYAVKLKTVNCLKGPCDEEYTIPVLESRVHRPHRLQETDPMSERSDGPVHVAPGSVSLWHLQAGREGKFFDDFSIVYRDLERGKELDEASKGTWYWTKGSFDYAPVEVFVPKESCVPLATGETDTSLTGLLPLAELFLRNAAARDERYGYYLNLLTDLSPDEMRARGWRVEVEGENKVEAFGWIPDAVETIFAPETDQERLDLLAVQIIWGHVDKEQEFVDIYRANPGMDLSIRTPRMTRESLIQLIDVYPPRRALRVFASFGDALAYREELLRVGVERFGELPELDRAILESLAELYDRPDLHPMDPDTKRFREDLSAQKEAARELARNIDP